MTSIKKLTSYRNLYAFGNKLPIDLSLSENPLGCSPKIQRVIQQLRKNDFFDYPDPDCNELKKVISKRLLIQPECIFVTNGSEAIIKLIPQVLLAPGDEVIIPTLTFPMFAIASTISGGKVIRSKMTRNFDIDLYDIRNKITSKTRLIFLCNPNNPTGKIISKKSIVEFVNNTNLPVVVDEANIEFGGETVIQATKNTSNLIVLRTFSKGFGLAGFRIGYCVANKETVQLLQRYNQPFPVSSAAQKAAMTAFTDTKFIEKSKKYIQKERNFVTNELRKRGFTVIQSEANNLLVLIPKSIPDFVKKLNAKGISVVDSSSFAMNTNDFIRVSPRTRKINQLFIQAIDNIMRERQKS